MGYLILQDYRRQIQSDNLQQIIAADDSIRISAELAAVAEAQSYLVQKYDTTSEFTETLPYNATLIYKAMQRVYLDAVAYDATISYTAGSFVTYQNNVYKANQQTQTGAFNPAVWTLVGVNNALYFACYPALYPVLFNINNNYAVGDKVFWKNMQYTCTRASQYTTAEYAIQFYQQSNIPLQNTFPDDAISGATQWKQEGAYSVSAGLLPNTTYWTIGDNRSQQMVMFVIDICLFHLHSRIAPRNIPELRLQRYESALGWLGMVAKGNVTAALPLLQPLQGNRIRYGGNVKLNNRF